MTTNFVSFFSGCFGREHCRHKEQNPSIKKYENFLQKEHNKNKLKILLKKQG